MSDQYVGTDGYKPLLLPERGEDLQEGRQYLLTPLARVVLDQEFGYRGVPTVVTCTARKVAATRIRSHRENLETGEQSWSIIDIEPQAAQFRAFLAFKRLLVFPLDIAQLAERAPAYLEAHKIPDSLVDDWNEETKKYPVCRTFRGCTLRWWESSTNERSGTAARLSASAPRRKIDLSCLD